MHAQRNEPAAAGEMRAAGPEHDAGPFRIFERWPALHLVVAAGLLAGGALNREWLISNPAWLWFVVLAIPVIAVHEWEEFRLPGGFRRWYNLEICRSGDPDAPMSKKESALSHMPLLLLFPLLAALATRWPWLGLGGLYGLFADGMFHISATGSTRRYSPGLITALLLYLPLGLSATYFFIARDLITLPELLAAALGGVIGFNVFLFLPMWRAARTSGNIAASPRRQGATRVSANAHAISDPVTAIRNEPNPLQRPDEVLPATRRAGMVVIPILALAFVILYLTPDNNGPRFAWTVEPRMTAMLLGATYLTGVIYFGTVLRARAWHQVRLGLLPVALFSGMLGVTTVLHWPEFAHANPQFWLWTLLYFTLPIALVVIWLRNERRAAPLAPVPADVLLGRTTRLILAAIGVGLAATTLALFLTPGFMIRAWPWQLTVLNARITAAELGLFSFFALHVAIDAHWSQVRDLLRPQLASPLLFLGAVVVSRRDFDWSNPLAWAFAGFVIVVFVLGFPALYLAGEARRRAHPEAAAAAPATAVVPAG